MELPPWQEQREQKTMWEDIKEGFVYVRDTRRILHIIALSYVLAAFGAPYNRFVPIFATNILHIGPTGFGLLMAAPGVGATLAALFLASVQTVRVHMRRICGFVIGFAISLALFAFSHSFVLSFLFLAMVGFCQIGSRALSNTAIQMMAPTNLLGRVLSVFFMDRGLWSLGSVLMGAAASVVGISWTFTACATVCVAASSSLLLSNSRRRARAASLEQSERRAATAPDKGISGR